MTGTLRNIILLSLLGFPAAAQALIGSDAAQADLAEAYRLRGLRYHGESGYDRQAIADHTAVPEIEPRSNIYFNRLQLLRFSGDETGAFADLEEAFAAAREIDPYSPHNGSLEAALAGLD